MWVKIYTFDNSNGEKIWENLPKNPIWQWLMYKRIYMGLNGVSMLENSISSRTSNEVLITL